MEFDLWTPEGCLGHEWKTRDPMELGEYWEQCVKCNLVRVIFYDYADAVDALRSALVIPT